MEREMREEAERIRKEEEERILFSKESVNDEIADLGQFNVFPVVEQGSPTNSNSLTRSKFSQWNKQQK